MSDDVPKLEDTHFLTSCLLVLDHGKPFPEVFHPQIAARFQELLLAHGAPFGPKQRGRRPGKLRDAVLLVNDAMQTGDKTYSQAAVCSAVAVAFGLKSASLEREYQKWKANQGAGKLI